MVSNLILVLLEIYCSLQQCKDFANPPRIDKVIAMVRVAPFFDSRCIYRHESKHSGMGPVRQNPIQRTVRSVNVCVCIALCTVVARNIAQNRSDNFPSYPPDNHHCSDDVCLREGSVNT